MRYVLELDSNKQVIFTSRRWRQCLLYNSALLVIEEIPQIGNSSQILAHLQFSVGGYPKIVLRRYMKKGRSDTPLS